MSKYLYQTEDPSELTAEQKDTISSITSITGTTIGASTGNVTDAVNAGETAKVAVENNGIENVLLPHEIDEIKNNPNYSREQLEAIQRIPETIEAGKKYILIGTSFIPVIGDIQGFVEAETAGDYVFASIGLVPLYGDALQKAHKAEKAYEKAKAAKDSEGMKKASQEAVNVLKSQGKASEVTGSQIIKKVENGQNVKPARRGTTGDWNKTLNKPAPNAIVKTDNGFIYKTDKNSRVTSVEADLSLDTNARNGYQQRVSGRKDRLDDDHGGHLIASMFGGPGEGINIVAMNAKFNGSSGEWYKMEQVWQKALDSKKSVKVKIEPIYYGNSKRPSEFIIRQEIDGIPFTQKLKNTATGK